MKYKFYAIVLLGLRLEAMGTILQNSNDFIQGPTVSLEDIDFEIQDQSLPVNDNSDGSSNDSIIDEASQISSTDTIIDEVTEISDDGSCFIDSVGLINPQDNGSSSSDVTPKKKKQQAKWTCPECNAEIQNVKKAVEEHIDSKHRKVKNFNCEICKNTFVSERAVKEHAKFTHGLKPQCVYCNRKVCFRGFKGHIFRKHGPKEPIYKCQKCGQAQNISQYSKHLKTCK